MKLRYGEFWDPARDPLAIVLIYRANFFTERWFFVTGHEQVRCSEEKQRRDDQRK